MEKSNVAIAGLALLSSTVAVGAPQVADVTSPSLPQYVAMVRQHIESRWARPASARKGLECEIRITQRPDGVVDSMEIGRCNGDAAVRQSIEAAVLRSSPLPKAPETLFERNLVLVFAPNP